MKALTALFAIVVIGLLLVSVHSVSSVSLPAQGIAAHGGAGAGALPRSEMPSRDEKTLRLATHRSNCGKNGRSCTTTGTDVECCTHWCGSNKKCAPVGE